MLKPMSVIRAKKAGVILHKRSSWKLRCQSGRESEAFRLEDVLSRLRRLKANKNQKPPLA